jgi:GNAT superfamily N-acetyltransferase
MATVADAAIIARHRAEMFRDMGALEPHLYDALVAATVRFLENSMPSGEYVGWLAAPAEDPALIVAGAGVLLRRPVPPHPQAGSDTLGEGPQGLVINVFTEKPWRRQGLARLLMECLIAWAADSVETLVLHASPEGRPLYESLGFAATNEMRYRP